MSASVDLVAEIHGRLNGTTVPRRPRPGTAPPLVAASSRPLQVPPRPGGDLGAVQAGRRSAYRFGGPPSLDEVASVIHHGVGTAPRAGGLPSLVSFLATAPGGDLPTGVHRVDPRLPVPSVVAVRAGDPTSFVAQALDQPAFATRVPLWLVLVADVGVALGRYPARHYRTLHLDAGVALQNALLVAAALGLSACPVMGYDDDAWAELLDLDDRRFVAVLLALGRPGSTVAPARPG